MSPWNRTTKSPKSLTCGSLLIAGESTLPHPPGYLVKHAVNCPERSLAGHSPRYSVRNPENYLGGYSISYRAGCLPENPASCRAGCMDSDSADYSADCPDNRPERNPESNPESNGAGYSERYSADCLPEVVCWLGILLKNKMLGNSTGC